MEYFEIKAVPLQQNGFLIERESLNFRLRISSFPFSLFYSISNYYIANWLPFKKNRTKSIFTMFDSLDVGDFVGDISVTKQLEKQPNVDVKQGYLRQNNLSEMSETKQFTILPMLPESHYWHYLPQKCQV